MLDVVQTPQFLRKLPPIPIYIVSLEFTYHFIDEYINQIICQSAKMMIHQFSKTFLKAICAALLHIQDKIKMPMLNMTP